MPRIDKVPVISTGHLSAAVAKQLEDLGDNNPWTSCASYLEGFFLYAQSEPEPDTPESLKAIFAWVREQGAEWVRLDCDGDAIDELPQYDW
jgi:hypothetical protein